MTLKVCEIFHSIQGETLSAGFPSVFVRLTGCNLNCRFCDTQYAKNDGTIMSIDSVLREVCSFNTPHHITITGGEPLLQPGSIELMEELSRKNFRVQLETNGSLSVKDVPGAVRKIIDVKTPGSGEVKSFLLENLYYLQDGDELKFVICDMEDFTYTQAFMEEHSIGNNITINFSPASMGETMPVDQLAELILKSGREVRLNLQIHKYIWPGKESV